MNIISPLRFAAWLFFILAGRLTLLGQESIKLSDKNYPINLVLDNPKNRAEDIINNTAPFYQPSSAWVIKATYQVGRTVAANGGAYVLFEAPDMAKTLMQGGLAGLKVKLGKDAVYSMIEKALGSPHNLSLDIAANTITEGLKAYDDMYRIASKYLKTGNISECDAKLFLELRWDFLKIVSARKLFNASYEQKYKGLTRIQDVKELKSFTNELLDNEDATIIEMVEIITRMNRIMESSQTGLRSYQPYETFLQEIKKIVDLQIRENQAMIPQLHITSPRGIINVDDEISEIKVSWTSRNIARNRQLGLVFTKDDQEIDLQDARLHYIYNSGELRFNLPANIEAGNNYRIYLFLKEYTGCSSNQQIKIVDALSPKLTLRKKKSIDRCVQCMEPASNSTWLLGKRNVVQWPKNFSNEQQVYAFWYNPKIGYKNLGTIPNTGFNKFLQLPTKKDMDSLNYILICDRLKKDIIQNDVDLRGSGFSIITAFLERDLPGGYENFKIQERDIEIVMEYIVKNSKVRIELFDFGKIDGDIASVYFNGEQVVAFYGLQRQVKEIDLNLVPRQANLLVLYAHNLGDIPPNTLAVRIIDGDREEVMELRSDLTKSQAISLILN